MAEICEGMMKNESKNTYYLFSTLACGLGMLTPTKQTKWIVATIVATQLTGSLSACSPSHFLKLTGSEVNNNSPERIGEVITDPKCLGIFMSVAPINWVVTWSILT